MKPKQVAVHGDRRTAIRRERKSSFTVEHNRIHVLASVFKVVAFALIGSTSFSLFYSLSYWNMSFLILIPICESICRVLSNATFFYYAYPNAFSSAFNFRLFWGFIFTIYTPCNILYYLAQPNTTNGLLIQGAIPQYWTAPAYFTICIYGWMYIYAFAFSSRVGNPKASPPTLLKYFVLAITLSPAVSAITSILGEFSIVSRFYLILSFFASAAYGLLVDRGKKDISFCGYYMFVLILGSQYSSVLLKTFLSLAESYIYDEGVKQIFTAIGIQIMSYIFLRGIEMAAKFSCHKSQKWPMLLPLYLQISLFQLIPYFHGGMLLQSSTATTTFLKMFAIHQLADLFKNSGLGSFALYLCKLIWGKLIFIFYYLI